MSFPTSRPAIPNIEYIKSEVGSELCNKKGKFLKRLKKFCLEAYKRFRSGYTGIHTSEIYTDDYFEKRFDILKDALNQFLTPVTGLQFCFTEKFDWLAGDFGDSGSCFFNDVDGRGWSRKLLEYNNFRAMKIYNKEGKGIARALFLPESLISPRKRGWFMFNNYGLSSDIIVKILTNYWGIPAHPVDIEGVWQDSHEMDIYVNGDTVYVFSNAIPSYIDHQPEIVHKQLPLKDVPDWWLTEIRGEEYADYV
jgi:hypothetical protein